MQDVPRLKIQASLILYSRLSLHLSWGYNSYQMLEQELLLEKGLFFLLNGSDSPFWDSFFYLYSWKWTWIPLYLCFLFVFIYKKNWKEILCVLLAVGLAVLLCDQISSGLFKPYFQRFRPTHHPDFKDTVEVVLGYRGGRYGFISSHAANAFGFATFVCYLFRNRIFTCTFILFAILNGYSRIYLGVHFISDVVVGSMVGVIIGYVVYELYNLTRWKWLKRPRETLKQPVYSSRETYALCISYSLMLILLLVLNNQLIIFFQ